MNLVLETCNNRMHLRYKKPNSRDNSINNVIKINFTLIKEFKYFN